jgi:hypothetical protein
MNDEADGAIASTRRGYQTPRADTRKAAQEAKLRQAACRRNLAQLEGADLTLVAAEARLTHLRGIKALGYALVLALLYLVTLPYDLAATSGLPLSPGAQLLAGACLGLLILVAAHLAAHKEQDVEEARRQQGDDPERYRQGLIQYRAMLWGGIALVVGIGIWRGFTFAAEAKATGGIFAGGLWTDLVFTVIALVGFFSAYVAAQAYLTLLPLRRVRADRKQNQRERAAQQDLIDASEQVQAEARLTLEFLEQDEAGVIEEIEAWREARRQQFMHDVRVREHRRGQQLKHGERPAGDPTTASPAMSAGDVRFRRPGRDGVVDNAAAAANHGPPRNAT